ncbi:FtsX-like permease family protein [Coleofasciculus sp. FACHB-1120]|uniref:FtsX-like permease family protein n=1 Tax=Coleofasciculus sp. FACHB-1120 TaxID=2692783 RepID=UPI00168213F4|nr:FtsX-like permease family protein [Coleofasciculus sp. FACHB-1120]MBD2742232.1 FtsX-like permease family protein [Coleofasciculus sp. FACHB-1120]
MASIARKNLFEDIPRFLAAQAGIMFAVSLVTIQTGIFNGFTRATTLLIDNSNADIWVSSADMIHMELTLPIPAQRVVEARRVEGVEQAEPLIVQASLWRDSRNKISPMRIIGFNPAGELFSPGKVIQGSLSALKQPYTVMLDKSNLRPLNIKQIGDVAEVGSFKAQLVALTQDTQSITSNTFLFTSLETANAYANSRVTTSLNCKLQSGDIKCTSASASFNNPPAANNLSAPAPQKLTPTDLITYVLVQAKPGQDLQQLKKKLEAALPDTRAYTKAEMASQTRVFWQQRTGIGFILGLGAVVGIIIGMAIAGQILYASVSDHLKEYGTLKAMGASDWKIYSVIVEQALWMAVLGYIPSMVLCLGLGAWTFATQGIIILITPGSAIAIFGITTLMCVTSAIFAIQRVTRVDPAIVFKA